MMADRKCQEDKENPVHNFVRTWSKRVFGRKTEKKEVQAEEKSPTSDTKPDLPDTPKEGITRKPSKHKKSEKRKPSKDDTSEERRNSNGCGVSFIHNIPPKPLSVLQIDTLLKSHPLEEAYPQLLSLRSEFQREKEALGETTSPVELTNKEKDLSLLYEALRTRVIDIIRDSCEKHSRDVLEVVVLIIQAEERREGHLGGIGGWRDAWKGAVKDGVRDTVKRVHLDRSEENVPRLAEDLDNLGRGILELLEKVKTELVNSYPVSFNVFETYVSSCHEVVGEHLKEIFGKITVLKDYYAMLDFIFNQYNSEKILGSPSLLPEMKKQNAFTLPDDFVNRVKDKYCNHLQEEFKNLLEKIIRDEQEKVWEKKAIPKTEDEPTSEILMEICKAVESHAEDSGKLDADLKKRVLCSCLEAIKHFPARFEEEFTKQSSSLLGSDVLDWCFWAKYHAVYINSFSLLKEHVESYKPSCPDQVADLEKEVDGLLLNLRQALLKQFKVETEPFMEIIMTKEWLNTDSSFNDIVNRIESYSGNCGYMRPLLAQSFINDLHYHVVKEYISQLLKKKYSCKGKKNDLAAEKIRGQWNEFKRLFSEKRSTLEWLYPLGDQLSEIIEQENEKDIINFLQPLIENYPDISESQLSAILYFRGVGKYLGKNPVIQHFTKLKQNSGKKNHEHVFFSDIK
ncbi:exocyst complex component 3-like protein 4 [Astyanax mexicanus]|uniref:exocyst complex component 3-like protein 4 n=1 Tax=Astyanax mexicanus TaxID=7994 RepID=UPI0020CAFC30|nr:exocyst complex component 3-like protein 4 [Astyanax mexicanus]XP_049337417.1 exocyst complex component 3-like protein 4 [Astyanax mexicanus]XP_049337418.1 exocyst complex component 3-like protein 4 [Astyanax mexicanus]